MIEEYSMQVLNEQMISIDVSNGFISAERLPSAARYVDIYILISPMVIYFDNIRNSKRINPP
jgi:hypothetical protein